MTADQKYRPPFDLGRQVPLSLSPQHRRSILRTTKIRRYDVLIIGGGINGAGIAYEAAMRGFSVLILDQGDLASGTSSRSSKLIHGGARYMKHGHFGLVFEALRERMRLLRLVPHLVRPMRFLYPIYRGDPDGPLRVRIGMGLYDLLALFRSPGAHENFRPEHVKNLEPLLRQDGLLSCPRYYDAWTNDARLVLAIALSAVRFGADILTYTEVRDFLRDGDDVTGVIATDRLCGRDISVEARLIVNAGGPWLDQVRRLERPDNPPILAPTKGVHALVPRDRLSIHHSVVFRSPDDQRGLFAIPWDRMTVLGTTETPFDGSPDEVYAQREDVEYLLRAVNHAFPESHLTVEDVWSTYAGLRPLVREDGKSAHETSREHSITFGPGGVLSVGGGKLTTFRVVAEEAANCVAARLQERFGVLRLPRSYTHLYPLEGGRIAGAESLAQEISGRFPDRIPLDQAAHLSSNYGSQALNLLEEAERYEESLEPLLPGLPHSLAELGYSVRHELVERLSDVLMRRTQIHLETRDQGLSVAEQVALHLAPWLGWDSARIDEELRLYEHEAQRTKRCVDTAAV